MSTMRPRSHSTDFTMPSLSRTNELIVSNNSHEEQFILVDEPPSPTTPTPSSPSSPSSPMPFLPVVSGGRAVCPPNGRRLPHYPTNHSTNQPTDQPTNQPTSRPASQPASQRSRIVPRWISPQRLRAGPAVNPEAASCGLIGCAVDATCAYTPEDE